MTIDQNGAAIEGTAVFTENGIVARLAYRIDCTADWRSHHAKVTGWIGGRAVCVVLSVVDGIWSAEGVPMKLPAVMNGTAAGSGLPDVDLGFTPATNANAIRRLDLSVGAMAETTALWLDVDKWALKPLRQIYRRLDHDRYEYLSPDNDYRVVLTVNEVGMVTDYPDLWAAI